MPCETPPIVDSELAQNEILSTISTFCELGPLQQQKEGITNLAISTNLETKTSPE